MTKRFTLAFAILAAFALHLTVAAAPAAPATPAAPAKPEVSLKVGDAAPALQVDKWLKGEPVKEFEKGKIYVIECWATWCGPCIASMPHVTKMQAKFKNKGVIVLGVDVWERDKDAAEPFVKKQGDKMGYSVCTDDLSAGAPGKMASTWLQAAGRNGIPCSFIVDRKSKIAWIGHPMQMERVLGLLADDKFDPAAEAKFTEQVEKLQKELSAAMQGKEDDKAITTLDQLAAIDASMAGQYAMMKYSILMRKPDYAAANTLAATLAADKSLEENTNMLGGLAFTMLQAPEAAKVDVALALKLAEKAYAGNKDNWQFQQLLAKAHAANKQFDKAVEFQTKALETIPPPLKDREQKTLDEYKAKAEKK